MSFKRMIQHIKSLFITQRPNIVGKIKYEFFFHAQNTKPSDIPDLVDELDVKFMVTQGKKGLQADKVEKV